LSIEFAEMQEYMPLTWPTLVKYLEQSKFAVSSIKIFQTS